MIENYPHRSITVEEVRKVADEMPKPMGVLGDDTGEKSWNALKCAGSGHYKSGGVEPIDLYRDAGMFRPFALCSIIKYAYRNHSLVEPVKRRDMEKIIHYARLLIASCCEDGK
jgi:hypothetical protein